MTHIERRPSRRILIACVAASLAGTVVATMAGCGPAPTNQAPRTRLSDAQGRRQTPQPGRQQTRDARDEFERTHDRPINADTYFAAGQLAETQDAPARAEEQYRKALSMTPNHPGSLFRLGVMYAKQKRYAEAIDAWNRYTRATGGNPTAFANLGFCLELAGRTDDAEAAYLKGIKQDPTNAPCRVNYGLLLARHDRMSEAVLEMQTVLPEAAVHYNLASVYEGLGRREQAKIEYRKALAADPQMNEAQARLDALN